MQDIIQYQCGRRMKSSFSFIWTVINCLATAITYVLFPSLLFPQITTILHHVFHPAVPSADSLSGLAQSGSEFAQVWLNFREETKKRKGLLHWVKQPILWGNITIGCSSKIGVDNADAEAENFEALLNDKMHILRLHWPEEEHFPFFFFSGKS